MGAFISKLPCEHKPIYVGGGILTGGKNKEQQCAADLWVHLDQYYNEVVDHFDFIDTQAEKQIVFNTKQRHIVLPITDLEIPTSMKHTKRTLDVMHEYIFDKKQHVHVHCMGGHGRTGMILACFLGLYTEISDPVEWLRKNYCEKAVETIIQHMFVHKITQKSKPSADYYYKKSDSFFAQFGI
jgi:protein-tyrosine phosphatase